MPTGKAMFTFILSTAAIFGPLSYIFFAFYEMGRLGYFGAPSDFLQGSSFGIIPVISAIYPGILLTLAVSSFIVAMRYVHTAEKFAMVCAAALYVTLILGYVSITSFWQWTFGGITACLALILLVMKRSTPDIGNEIVELPPIPVAPALRYFASVKLGVCVLGMLVVVSMIWVAAGQKQSATQSYYWISGRNVVLGFYGDKALVGELDGVSIGPSFRFVDLKAFSNPLSYQRIGPLKPAAMWRSLPQQ